MLAYATCMMRQNLAINNCRPLRPLTRAEYPQFYVHVPNPYRSSAAGHLRSTECLLSVHINGAQDQRGFASSVVGWNHS